MLTELRRKDRRVFPVFKLFLAEPRCYGDIPISSATLGKIAGDVTPDGWGQVRRAVSDDDGGLVFNNTSVQIRDQDRATNETKHGAASRPVAKRLFLCPTQSPHKKIPLPFCGRGQVEAWARGEKAGAAGSIW